MMKKRIVLPFIVLPLTVLEVRQGVRRTVCAPRGIGICDLELVWNLVLGILDLKYSSGPFHQEPLQRLQVRDRG